MTIHHSWSVALQTLLQNPLRTLLSTLGVVIGVGSLVAILSLGDGLEQFTRDEIAATTDLQMITIDPITTDRIDDVVVRRLSYTVFTPADERDLATRLGDRAGVGTSLSYATFWNMPGDTARAQAVVTAATPGYLDMVPAELLAGRFLSPDDVANGTRVAIISTGMARLIAHTDGQTTAPDNAIGRTFRIGDIDYSVVGVARADGDTDSAAAPERVSRIAIPLAPAEALPGLLDIRTPTLAVRAADVADVEALRASTEAWLEERWGGDDGDFNVSSNVMRVAQAQRGILVFKLVMGAITGI